jgi:hypothetical protein
MKSVLSCAGGFLEALGPPGAWIRSKVKHRTRDSVKHTTDKEIGTLNNARSVSSVQKLTVFYTLRGIGHTRQEIPGYSFFAPSQQRLWPSSSNLLT